METNKPGVDRGITLAELFSAAYLQRRILGGGILIGAILALVVAILAPSRYSAAALVKTRGESQGLGGLSGIAAEFGVQLPVQSGGYSPDFVRELSTSRVVLERVAERILADTVNGSDGQRRLIRDVEERPVEDRPEELARRLRDIVQVAASPQSGLIEIKVLLPGRGYAATVVALVLQETMAVLESVRQDEARESRDYFERVTRGASEELRVAEDRLEAFLARNRSVQNSPALQVEAERLQREVNRRQEISLALYRGMAEAALSEQRTLSAVSVVQPPVASRRAEPRRALLKLLVGAAFGFGCASSWLVLRAIWARRALITFGV